MEETSEKKSKYNITSKLRENPWILSTLILGVLAIIFLFSSFAGMTGNVSKEVAGEKLVAYLNTVADSEVTLIETIDDDTLYKIIVGYQGQQMPIYVTKDGKNYTPSLSPIIDDTSTTSTPSTTSVSKSDSPVVGLYIWSYCPYGVTALTPFAEVASLLGDYADFKVYLYYAGHGDFEVQQNKIQACVQKVDSAKYWDYAEGFVNDIYEKCYGDIDCDLSESKKLMNSLGIDSDAVMTCVDSHGESLLEDDYNAARTVSVSGSPTLVVNGEKVSASRTAESFKTAVCSAFNDAPGECSETLDSAATTASGNC